MTGSAHETWDSVDFGSTVLRIPEDGPGVDVPPNVTNIEAQDFARSHFPDGPISAVETQQAWLAWQGAVAAEKQSLSPTTLFHKTKIQIPEAAKAWDAFVNDWESHSFRGWESESRRCLANINWRAGISLNRPQLNRVASWRDRRPSARDQTQTNGRQRSKH